MLISWNDIEVIARSAEYDVAILRGIYREPNEIATLRSQ